MVIFLSDMGQLRLEGGLSRATGRALEATGTGRTQTGAAPAAVVIGFVGVTMTGLRRYRRVGRRWAGQPGSLVTERQERIPLCPADVAPGMFAQEENDENQDQQ
jgi:hypothetical protein